MEGEIFRTFEVWFIVLISLCYCYVISNRTRKGLKRLCCVIPVVCLFLLLPLRLHSVNIGGITGFFIAWLANFKLLLFAFGKGPLCANSSVSLPYFIAITCLPIKVQQNPPPKSETNQNPVSELKNGHKSLSNYAAKGLLFCLLISTYRYKHYIHPLLLFAQYICHIYFSLEIILAGFGAVVRAMLGIELEPQFNEPYLSTSLQDFWGRRWNLVVSGILRLTVYDTTCHLASSVVGRNWARVAAVMATFLMSALMHELLFYYLGRMRPTWEMTLFFVIQGVCVVIEIALKEVLVSEKLRLPQFVSIPLTLGFLMATGFWLFFPELLRCKVDVKAFEEYAAFLKNVGRSLSWLTLNTSDG